MDETLNQLKIGLNSFTANAANACLTMNTNWKINTPGVSKVCVRLAGQDPLTGNELPTDYLTASFDHLTSKFTSVKLPLYGTYELQFEAFDKNGFSLGIFWTQKIDIKNPDKCPRLTYSLYPATAGWTCVEIQTNCWKRVCGHLWIEYNNRQYLLRDKVDTRGHMRIYIPSINARLFTDNENLPEPQRRKG